MHCRNGNARSQASGNPDGQRLVFPATASPNLQGWQCFCDGVIFSSLGIAGFGAVLEDAEGQYIQVISGVFPSYKDSHIVEAMALRACLAWIQGKFLSMEDGSGNKPMQELIF
ncbi:hypothetical protein JCGZ_19516 [Jatropha curcas]|uniref:RNase H type-1 domain-containing protein n=1 Tax=Jatropha curcas TaxID=180498 RepID=A0A067K1M4_JATCU|nr:hypothetical protein JCGZ_19516 [Jatropha curcas]